MGHWQCVGYIEVGSSVHLQAIPKRYSNSRRWGCAYLVLLRQSQQKKYRRNDAQTQRAWCLSVLTRSRLQLTPTPLWIWTHLWGRDLPSVHQTVPSPKPRLTAIIS